MYSLVSACVLAADLARHPHGAAVADVVDRVLVLSPAELTALAEAAADGREVERDLARARAVEACASAPRMHRLLSGVRRAFADGLPTAGEARVVADALADTPLGGLDDLLVLLRREAPLSAAPAAAAQPALDAVVAAWAGREALADAAVLRSAWMAAVPPWPVPLPDVVEDGGALSALLEAVPRLGPGGWRRVERARRAAFSGSLRWSAAMHASCRVAEEAGRTVAVARAQLAAARSLRLSGASAGPAARGAAMAVTAAVQATGTRDLLDDVTAELLLGPWRAGAGAAGA